MINAAKAKELDDQVAEAIDRGAVPLHRGTPSDARFLPGQDTVGVRPAGHPPQPAPVLPAPPRGTVRPGRHDRPGRHRGGTAGRHERLQRRARRHPLHRRPRRPTTASPRRSARSRSATARPAPAATATSSSAASARPGAAPSSAANCSSARSPGARRGSGCPGNFPDYHLMPCGLTPSDRRSPGRAPLPRPAAPGPQRDMQVKGTPKPWYCCPCRRGEHPRSDRHLVRVAEWQTR